MQINVAVGEAMDAEEMVEIHSCHLGGYSLYANVDDNTGDVTDVKCAIYGENVTGKVLVYPAGCGSTTNCWILYTMGQRGNAPAAIINANLDTIQVVGAVCAEIPMLRVSECDPVAEIRTGDLVEINGDTGEIIVTKK